MKEISSSFKAMLEESAPHSLIISGRCSIHRAPERLHKCTERSQYKPETISIGPFHHQDQSLKAREILKLSYANSLLIRTANRKLKKEEEGAKFFHTELDSSGALVTNKEWFAVLGECISSVTNMETKIRQCYSEPIAMDSREFVKMMVIDGLFIIELLVKVKVSEQHGIAREHRDPICRNNWLLSGVIQDLILLENQLPMFVLECLFKIVAPADESLKMLALHLFDKILHLLPAGKTLDLEQSKSAAHLLDLLGMLLQTQPRNEEKEIPRDPESLQSEAPSSSLSWIRLRRTPDSVDEKETKCSYFPSEYIPSASELQRAGVTFKKGSKEVSFMDVKFGMDGIFEMSPIHIHDDSELIFRNLIACEQSYSTRDNVTSYAVLMDSLIDSAEDVKILRKQGIIIVHNLGCDEDVAKIFNKLRFHTGAADNYSKLNKEVMKYYRQSWHRWQASLKREYFGNPWTIVSLLAAVLLILLTIVSTVSGILQVVYNE
ncbi:hypothetical protein MKW94_018445 [Papaver nudicaule]|uniref:Uncharacterized protein n=1 Tax=Papaver nudicaule TaxID=74823 RepID=A0AA41VV41_PAPNU|nr:hypothetical protein [Papaver nudicaule]